jgi:phage shock protein A
MDEGSIERAQERVAEAAEGRPQQADLEAALERARAQIEQLAAAAAELEGALPERIESTIKESLRAEAAPMSRRVNEIRGMSNQTIRRLERMEHDLTAERYSRVDDLGLLVDLIASGWRSLDRRLARIEQVLEANGATVYRIDERRPA